LSVRAGMPGKRGYERYLSWQVLVGMIPHETTHEE